MSDDNNNKGFLNDALDAVVPKKLDDKLLAMADSISTSAYARRGTTNYRLAEYLNIAGALAGTAATAALMQADQPATAAIAGGITLVELVKIFMNQREHTIYTTDTSPDIVDKIPDLKSKNRVRDELKAAELNKEFQETCRKQRRSIRFSRFAGLLTSLTTAVLGTTCLVYGLPEMAIGFYAGSVALSCEAKSQYLRAAEIKKD